MPPVFLFESIDDQRISPLNSTLFANALRGARVPAEAHMFSHGEHGSRLSIGVNEEEGMAIHFCAVVFAAVASK
jgi:hypothetical protein